MLINILPHSLGVKEEYIKKNIPKYADRVTGNETQLQPNDSKKCGFFCCFFIIHRLLNLDISFDELCNSIFSSNEQENDKQVEEFVQADAA